jgi:two-component system response regulator RegA
MKSALLIDDDEAFLRVLTRSLKKAGYDVMSATGLDGMKQALRVSAPDFAVIDLHLGCESGLDVVEYLASECPDTLIVMLSGYINVTTAAAAIRLGASDCLVKPVGIDELEHAFIHAISPARAELPSMRDPGDVRVQHIVIHWEKNERNSSKTARLLGMHRRSLQRILTRAGISRDDVVRHPDSSRFKKLRRLYRVWEDATLDKNISDGKAS